MSVPADDDPLHPRRWMARGGEGGPVTGDEYAYLKDLVHRQMGVGNWEPGPREAAPAPWRWRGLLDRFRRR
ncbi:MAG TPA: hypothetical protein VN029_03625 [Sphingomonas sp.]|nr:hypothetical protein [Sphingomonas sp.]